MSPPGAFEAREVVKPILYEGRPHRSILRSYPSGGEAATEPFCVDGATSQASILERRDTLGQSFK